MAAEPRKPAPAEREGAEPDLFAGFAEVLGQLDGVTHRAPSHDEARAKARELIGDASVARWEDAELDDVAPAAAPPADAEVSLIIADVGIAETGQIGFVHRSGRPRAAALLPDRQIALLPADALVRSVAEAFARLGLGGGAHPGHAVLVAGPSRTADIEQRMILGVHGPRTLDVIVYDRN